MREYKLNAEALKIMAMARNNYILVQMAKTLGRSEAAISQKTDTLAKHGFFTKAKAGTTTMFLFLPKGEAIINDLARIGAESLSNRGANQGEPFVRLHRNEFKWDLLVKPSFLGLPIMFEANKIDYKRLGLNNQEGYTFVSRQYAGMITGKSLLLIGQEKIGRYSQMHKLLLEMYEEAEKNCRELEVKLGIKIKRVDKYLTYAHCTKIECAFLDNPYAKIINKGKSS